MLFLYHTVTTLVQVTITPSYGLPSNIHTLIFWSGSFQNHPSARSLHWARVIFPQYKSTKPFPLKHCNHFPSHYNRFLNIKVNYSPWSVIYSKASLSSPPTFLSYSPSSSDSLSFVGKLTKFLFLLFSYLLRFHELILLPGDLPSVLLSPVPPLNLIILKSHLRDDIPQEVSSDILPELHALSYVL